MSGHIGFRVLAEAVKAGFRARAVVRKDSQVQAIKSTASIKPYVSKIQFVIIPDFTAKGAFDRHLDGVSFVIHVASPAAPSGNAPINVAEYTGPPVAMTKDILKAASEAPSVKRVVITSSIVTMLTGVGLQGDSDLVYTREPAAPLGLRPSNKFSFRPVSSGKGPRFSFPSGSDWGRRLHNF